MSVDELACTYAALILHDEGLPVTSSAIVSLTKAASISVEPFYPTLFSNFFESKPLKDIISNVGGGAAATETAAAPAAGGSAETADKPAAKPGKRRIAIKGDGIYVLGGHQGTTHFNIQAAAPAEESDAEEMDFGLFD